MEERIIDDEYGRGVRLKKTKDGFIDATDETLQDWEEVEEAVFEFPVLETDEDDEDLVGLSPEEAIALRKKKEEEAPKAPPAPSKEELLLTEIRDILKEK